MMVKIVNQLALISCCDNRGHYKPLHYEVKLFTQFLASLQYFDYFDCQIWYK